MADDITAYNEPTSAAAGEVRKKFAADKRTVGGQEVFIQFGGLVDGDDHNKAKINADGQLAIRMPGLIDFDFDEVQVDYPDADTTTFSYLLASVAKATITLTRNPDGSLASVVKS